MTQWWLYTGFVVDGHKYVIFPQTDLLSSDEEEGGPPGKEDFDEEDVIDLATRLQDVEVSHTKPNNLIASSYMLKNGWLHRLIII